MRHRSGGWRAALAVAVALASSACGGHSSTTLKARTALDAGRPKAALAEYNELLDVESVNERVKDASGDASLYLLDRSMVLQQLRDYPHSSSDLETADKAVELLDFAHGTIDDIGRYLYSDDTGPYKAPAYEKVMINTMNMVNYLVRGDLNGARIEARRLAVMQKFLSEHDNDKGAWVGPGSYLAGFVFERSNSSDEAMQFYRESLEVGLPAELAPPVIRLGRRTGFTSPRFEELAAATRAQDVPEGSAELLIVASYGRVPVKVAKRIPIGLALTYASMFMSPAKQAQANELAAQGLVTWINYPELGKRRIVYETPQITIDGVAGPAPTLYPIDEAAVAAWNKSKGAVIASAITRLITRVVAGQVARRAAKDNVIGVLLSLGTQATLTALDTPDTRSWGTLPSEVAIYRVNLPPGKHVVTVSARGEVQREEFVLEPNGWKALNLTVLR
ncbi:MAG: hypothetical protein R3A78_13960 [Polyangiales bacterium]